MRGSGVAPTRNGDRECKGCDVVADGRMATDVRFRRLSVSFFDLSREPFVRGICDSFPRTSTKPYDSGLFSSDADGVNAVRIRKKDEKFKTIDALWTLSKSSNSAKDVSTAQLKATKVFTHT